MSAVRILCLCVVQWAVAAAYGLDFTPSALPWAIVDQAYEPPSLTILEGARCPESDTNFTAEGLPEGLTITGTGQIEGVPRQVGTYRVAVRVANSCDAMVRRINLVVTGAPILTVSRNTIDFYYHRGGRLPAAQTLLVAGSWPDLAYDVDGRGAAWVRASPRKGRIPRPGAALNSDLLEISVRPGDLAPGGHEVVVVLSTPRGVNTPLVTVRLLVE